MKANACRDVPWYSAQDSQWMLAVVQSDLSHGEGLLSAAQFWARSTFTATAAVPQLRPRYELNTESYAPHGGPIFVAVMQPAGEVALTAGADGKLRLWRRVDGTALLLHSS